jgi:Flp pilus assembly protein TadG
MVYAAMTRCRLRLGYHRMGASQQGSSDPLGQPHQAASSQPIQHRRAEMLPMQLGQGQKETGVVKSGLFSRLSRLGKDQHASGSRLLVRLIRDEAGSYVVYMTLVLPILIGTTGLASQGAWWLNVHQTMQNAADSAALSAAAALSTGADPTTQANAITSAYCALPGNPRTCFVNGQNNVTVTTTVNTSAKSVEVTVAQPQPVLFPSTSLSVSKNISAGAAAMYLPIARPNSNNNNTGTTGTAGTAGTTDTCILALATTGTAILVVGNGNTINMAGVNGCGMFSNSTISVPGSSNTITASNIGTVGGVSSPPGSGDTFSPTPTRAPSVPDPYLGLATTWPSPPPCSGSSCDAGGPAPCPNGESGSCLSPGVYSTAVTLTSSTTLNPGVYYLLGGLSISGSVNGTGVTLVLGGMIDATSATAINITAPTTGWNAGIAIWDTRLSGSNVLANPSATVKINGVIYTPNTSLLFQGNTPSPTGSTPTCTQIVAQQVLLSGNISLQRDGVNCPHILVPLPLE